MEMVNKTFRSLFLVLILVFTFTGNAFSLPSQYELSLTGNLLVLPGDLVTLSLEVTIPDGNRLVSGDLNVAFDDSVLSLQDVRTNLDLFLMAPLPLTPTPVSLSFFSFDPLLGPGNYILADLDFLINSSTSVEKTALEFAGSIIPDGFVGLGDELLGDLPLSEIMLHGAEVSIGRVQPVPEPSTVVLIVVGLICIVGWLRFRRIQL